MSASLGRLQNLRGEDTTGLDGCNLNVPLWQLLRASTAAPMFFPPEQIDYGKRRFL
jgi:predicted acylesterase/phospholipase RssA